MARETEYKMEEQVIDVTEADVRAKVSFGEALERCLAMQISNWWLWMAT